MKKIILFFSVLLSCNSELPEEYQIDTEDSIIINSQRHLDSSAIIFQKSDSITNERVLEVMKEIQLFKSERLIREKNMMTVSQTVITRVDTVFIEVEKNFWGKKKIKTSISSDTLSIEEQTDTSELIEKIDTLQINK